MKVHLAVWYSLFYWEFHFYKNIPEPKLHFLRLSDLCAVSREWKKGRATTSDLSFIMNLFIIYTVNGFLIYKCVGFVRLSYSLLDIHGVSFRVFFFENAPKTKLLGILSTKYNFLWPRVGIFDIYSFLRFLKRNGK